MAVFKKIREPIFFVGSIILGLFFACFPAWAQQEEGGAVDSVHR